MAASLTAASAVTNLAAALTVRTGDMPAHPARGVAAVITRTGDRSRQDIPVGPDVVAIVRVVNPDGEEVDWPADEGALDQLLTRMMTGAWAQPALPPQSTGEPGTNDDGGDR